LANFLRKQRVQTTGKCSRAFTSGIWAHPAPGGSSIKLHWLIAW
jgi:hypothetical protein